MAIFDQLLRTLMRGGEEAAPAAEKIGAEMAAPAAGQVEAPVVAANPNAVAPTSPAVVPPVAPKLPAIDALRAATTTPVDTLARQTSPGPGPRNFNLNQFDPASFETPEQAMSIIQTMAKTHVEANPAFNEPRTWETVKQRAQNYSYEELMGTQVKGRILSDTETYAGVQLLGGLSEKLAKQSSYVADALESGTLTDADKVEFLSTAARTQALHNVLSGSVKEAARSTAILRATKAARMDTPSGVAQVQGLLQQFGGDEMVAGIADAMNLNIGNPAKALQQAGEVQKLAGWGDLIREYAINNMMSIPTHIKNNVGNIGATLNDVGPEGVLTSLFQSGIRRARGMTPSEANQSYALESVVKMQGAASAVSDALKVGLAHMMEDSATLANISKLGTGRPPAITAPNVQRLMQSTFGIQMDSGWKLGAINFLGRVARRHTVMLGAEDAFYTTLGVRAEQLAAEYRSGRQAGLSHDDALTNAWNTIENFDATRFATARDKVAEVTFNNPLPNSNPFNPPVGLQAGNDPVRALGGALQSALQNHPWAKFWTMPFLKVATNLLSWIYKRTPGVGLIQSDTGIALQALAKPMLDDMALAEQGSEAGAKVIAQQSVGAAITLWAWNQTGLGHLVGQLGFDSQATKDARRAHVQPNAIPVHDDAGNMTGSYSTQGFDPFSGMLNVTSTARETYLYAKTEDDAQTALAAIAWGWGKAVLDRGYLQGISQWIDLIDGPLPAGTKLIKFGTQMASPLFPGYGDLRRLTQTPESDVRLGSRYPLPVRGGAENVKIDMSDPSTVVDAILKEVQARSPYFNKDLLPNVNGWGQDILSWGNYIERNISPSVFVPMNAKDSGPRDDLLWRNGINHPTVAPTLTFGMAKVDVRTLTVPGKPDGWAWYDYQKTVGAARKDIIDSMAKVLPKDNDAATSSPGTNRQRVEEALAKGLKAGQAIWLGKDDVQKALASAGINPSTFTGSTMARQSLPGMENVRIKFGD
jgi:hypothetical protein